MIVKGIIKTINFSENSCTVRLPLFETAAADGEVILDAIISIQPGLYNGYTEGDVVFVDFENNKLSQPIVVGKLYLGAEKEAAVGAPSAMTVSNLKVTTQATLPVDTRLSLEGLGNIVPVEKGISSYHSLVDIIKALHQTETSVQQTIKDQSGTVSNIIVEYLSQPVGQEAPTAENTGWNITSPDYKDGFEIWQKTTCYNHRGQALSTEIICLSSIASAVIYKVRCSTRVHAGTNQTEAVKISAWVKLGTELETSDTSANICYCWSDGKGSALTDWIESGTYEVTLEPAQLRAQNLVIQVKHGSEVYEEETIMYAPLNTPVLHLSNETDVLLYAANGTDCLTATGVSSTATLYVNGDPLEATYAWEWDPLLCTCEHAVDEDGQQLQNTIIVTAVNSTSAPGVATCKATVTLDGPFKGKVYSKDFTVTQTKIGTSIISQETYYALIHNKHGTGKIKTPPKTGDLIVRDKDGNQLNTRSESQFEEWSLTPPEHTPDTNGWKYWTTVKTTYSTSLDDFEFSTPIINEDLSGVYALAQGKSTNYYSNEDPSKHYTIKEGDCWFDTGMHYVQVSPTADLANANGTFSTKEQYLGYFLKSSGDPPYTKITADNLTSVVAGISVVYKQDKNCLKQWSNGNWVDVGEELVANKITANYINALDITAKKIKILNDEGNTTLFEADGLSKNHTVKIAGFEVSKDGLYTDEFGASYSEAGKTNSGVYVGKDGIKLGKNFSVSSSGAVVARNLQIKDATSNDVDINTALNNTQAAAEATAQTNLENAFPVPDTSTYTTLGDKWLSTTNVYAQNLHVANADITNQILVGTKSNPILYANVNEAENVKIGGFIAGSTTLKGGTNGTVGMNSSSATGTYSFWAGNATPSNAPFYVTNAGAVKATNLTIQNMTASGTSGVTINGGKFTVKTKGTSPTTLFEVDSSASKTTLSGDIHNVGNIFSGCKKNSNNTISATTTTGGNIYSGGVIQSIGGIVNNKTLVNTGFVYSNGGIINGGILHSNGTITSNGEVYTTGNVYFYSNIKESDGKVTVSGGYNPVIQLAPANSNCLYTTLVDIATYTAGSGLNQGASWKTVTLPTGLYGSGNSKVKGAYVTGYLSSKNNLTVTNVTEGNCGKTSTSVTEIMNMGTQGYTPYVSWDNNNLYVLLPPIKVDSNVSPGFTIKMCVLIVGAI